MIFTTIQIQRLLIAACFVPIFACGTPSRGVLVTHVDARQAITGNGSDSPLKLVVDINADGKLFLNRIEVGTIADTSVLIEKLRTVFYDRQKASIDERNVVIEMNGAITQEDLEVLIDAVTRAQASSILVMRKAED